MSTPSEKSLYPALQWVYDLTERLKAVNPAGFLFELRQILEKVSDQPLLDLYVGDRALSSAAKEAAEEYARRRAAHEPLAYVLGRTSFMDFDLAIDEGTFIPRPETEVLVAEATTWCYQHGPADRDLQVLDLGSGSGNIAIGLCLKVPCVRVDAVEVSEDAADCLAGNLETFRLQDRVRVFRMDYQRDGLRTLEKTYDLILANPPYVSLEDYPNLPEEVRREPASSLIGGLRGDEMLKWIIEESRTALVRGGVLMLEMGMGQAEGLMRWSESFEDLEKLLIAKDHQGIDRVIVFRKVS